MQPDMREKISPEDKLLRLIRKPHASEPLCASVPDTAPAEASRSHAPFTQAQDDASVCAMAPMSLLHDFGSRLARYAGFVHRRYVRKLLYCLAGLSATFFAASFSYPYWGLRHVRLPDISQDAPGRLTAARTQEIKPVAFYLADIAQHTVFDVASAVEASAPMVAADANIMKDLTLVGIINDSTLRAVIEDTRSQKTYYVIKGQCVGDAEVEEIQEGRIIMKYKGQRYEFSL